MSETKQVTNKRELLDALKRTEYLLDVTMRFIKSNHIGEYRVFFDRAMCDGYCLADDCRIAAEEARIAIAKEEQQ